MQFDSVLFLCVANSARSQLAEGLARKRFGEAVRVQSAGSAPSRVNPFAARALEEVGIDPADHSSKHVDAIDPSSVDLVITLCAEEECPLFLGQARRMSWAMPDPDRKHEVLSDAERMAQFRKTREAIAQRIEVLAALREVPAPLAPVEFHASVRVPDLAAAARFYTWLLGVEPKEWTHRYVTFVSEALRTNFVVLVDDGKELHHDTLYHLGIELPDRAAVVDAHHRAVAAGWTLHKPARTTWRGTPLHELWLKDPGGNLVEIYARLTDTELAQMPADQAPLFLVEA
jgi:protein-tyrosine-phosphatase/catechol 2,3-dioxygenase-like lactoylglutathione lyase family enzyme